MNLQMNPFDIPRTILNKAVRRMCKYPYHQLVETLDRCLSALSFVVLASVSFSVAGANIEYITLAESAKESLVVLFEVS